MKRKKNALLVFLLKKRSKKSFCSSSARGERSLSLCANNNNGHQKPFESDEKGFALRCVYKYVSRVIAIFNLLAGA